MPTLKVDSDMQLCSIKFIQRVIIVVLTIPNDLLYNFVTWMGRFSSNYTFDHILFWNVAFTASSNGNRSRIGLHFDDQNQIKARKVSTSVADTFRR
jgi:hypothetical protein